MAAVAVFVVLANLPGRTHIPPHVSSDCSYQLLAADRLHDGLGLTSLQPVAPLQPWDWLYDWGFLTQWPVGYSLLVCGVRRMTGASTLEAFRWISVACCALALVGWFAWVKRLSPRGIGGTLLAAVAAGSSVSVALLIDPSTDAIVLAVLPFALLMTMKAVACQDAVFHKMHTENVFEKPFFRDAPVRKRAITVEKTLPHGRGSVRCDPFQTPSKGSVGANGSRVDSHTVLCLALAGLIAGGLFWIRYASIFIPLGIGAYLLVEWIVHRRLQMREVATFALSAIVPMVLLIVVNRAFGQGSTQAQMNLGGTIAFHFDAGMLTTAWWHFTAFGFYNYHPFSHWVFALWPAVMVIALGIAWKSRFLAVAHDDVRGVDPVCNSAQAEARGSGLNRSSAQAKACGSDLDRISAQAEACGSENVMLLGWMLSACVLAALFVVLIGTTTVFGGKYNYVALERYYQPVKPLYFVLFVTPVLWWTRRVVPNGSRVPRNMGRAVSLVTCIALLVACSWLVRYEWPRPYKRWLAADREQTSSGYWARCFVPGAADLFGWLKDQASPELIVVSNFHEFIALETNLATLPIPKDRATLDVWITRITAARGLTDARVLFVLDPDNKWREYWIPDPRDIVTWFALTPVSLPVSDAVASVYAYDSSRDGASAFP